MSISSSRQWAVEEFGDVELGDRRRRSRTLALASAIAACPGGRITQVCETDATREAAFRWVRNEGVDVRALRRSSAGATVRRCAGERFVYVAVDQSSVCVVDRAKTKGFGHVGSKNVSRGLHAMTALAVSESGATLGLVGQDWWSRLDQPSPAFSSDRRPLEERESSLWLTTMEQSLAAFEKADSKCEPWFQLDRGADASHVLLFAQERRILLTVRAAYNRRVSGTDGRYLWDVLSTDKVRGRTTLQLSRAQARRPGRSFGKEVTLSVRFRPVTLQMNELVTRAPHEVQLTAVFVRERNPPSGAERIEWMLLTTAPVKTLKDALQVVSGYTKRWRIEDFHRTWKTGRCHVESSQLRSPKAFLRWATLLAAVAARIERLKHLARNEPKTPAIEVFSRDELDAAIILSKTKKWKRGKPMSVVDAVHLVASIGGYTGKSSGGPPGAITLGRGLERVVHVAIGLAAARSDQ